MQYLNRFSIEEDDQFEIHVKVYTNEKYTTGFGPEDDIYNAAKDLMLKAKQGLGYYRLQFIQ